MNLLPMRYGNYRWPHNPKIYEIDYKRRIISKAVPFGLYTLEDMGRDQSIMRGEGEFAGPGAYSEFKRLATMFYKEEPQILVHPLWQPSLAWFVKLRLQQEPTENYVKYEFEFWECFDGYKKNAELIAKPEASAPEADTERKSYTVKYGDTLWGLAVNNGMTLQELLSLNPQIKNPNVYYPGDVVYLS